LRPLGVGINILPHASKIFAELGLGEALARVSILTGEAVFFNRFGSSSIASHWACAAGYDHPQYSIHRGELQQVLLDAVNDRLGPDAVVTSCKCVAVDQDREGASARFEKPATGEPMRSPRADVVVGCDGLHSTVRKLLHPDEGPPLYSGVNMWRGVAVWPPVLSGASMIRAGWLKTGKMVIYPIRDNVDGKAASSSTGLPRSKRLATRIATGTGRASSTTSSERSMRGISTGSMSRGSWRAPRRFSSFRWSTRIRCRGGRRDE
jgi:2-polyprenyl-6-methoxyphenol hydroxylase-like FAD-dependent oxidoreductase